MATDRQIESARINGAKSQGPVTPEGKAISAQNARKHGLSATVVLATESNPQFQQLLDKLVQCFPTVDPLEELLIEEMAVAKWRQRRTWSVEQALINDEIQRQGPDIAREYRDLDLATRTSLAIKTLTAQKVIYNLSQYESKQRCMYHKAEDKLKRHQKDSRKIIIEPDSAGCLPSVA